MSSFIFFVSSAWFSDGNWLTACDCNSWSDQRRSDCWRFCVIQLVEPEIVLFFMYFVSKARPSDGNRLFRVWQSSLGLFFGLVYYGLTVSRAESSFTHDVYGSGARIFTRITFHILQFHRGAMSLTRNFAKKRNTFGSIGHFTQDRK